MTYSKIHAELKSLSSAKQRKVNEWFFKTGPGEYGEGDRFVGIKVPVIRKVAKKHKDLLQKDLQKLVLSSFHEERLLGFIILTNRFKAAKTEQERKAVYQFYMKSWKGLNNWDLVDVSAPYVVGGYLLDKNRKILFEWSRSKNLWKKRISIMATFAFIRKNDFEDTLKISKTLLLDEHDLIHKAVGWMLREVGNRNLKVEERFLKKHYQKMPRTMLRYAIEKFPEKKRKAYLHGKI